MSDVLDLNIDALGAALTAGALSSVDATEACLEHLEKTADLGAFLHVDAAGARTQAAEADARRRQGQSLGPLDGIPLAIKDIMQQEGLPTTCASKILSGFEAPFSATCVQKLRDHGAVLLGKLNMDEFAMGSSNEHSAIKPARNPWNKACVPGGSSGGSAVAVAARQAFGSLGTDTGGSIRQPAALCGIVGLKPTYGRVSRYGVVAFASSLDQVGPMGKTVSDCAHILQAIAGHDPRDATSGQIGIPNFSEHLEDGVRGLKIGIPKQYLTSDADPEILQAIEQAQQLLQKLGATLVDVELPHTDHGIATYYVLTSAEASSNLARFDGVRYGLRNDPGQGLLDMYLATREAGFGPEVKRRIMLGTYALSAGYYDAYYLKAQKVRTLVKKDFENAFSQVDAMLTPTTPTVAWESGTRLDDPLTMYLSDVFTVGANLAGIPGLSLPCGFAKNGLPIGMQLLGSHWQEARLLQIARAYEREAAWHQERPQP